MFLLPELLSCTSIPSVFAGQTSEAAWYRELMLFLCNPRAMVSSLLKMVEECIPIDKLTLETKKCAITARVSRLWDSYRFQDEKDLLSTDMVLIDKQGSYIHASIKGNFSHLFKNRIAEGSVYYIKNFNVPNKAQYRVVGDNKLMIQLYATTVVRSLSEDSLGIPTSAIPNHRFDLLDFDKVESRMGEIYILTDVVGQVCCEGEVINKNSRGNSVPSLMLELHDLRDEKVRLTLWGDNVDNYMRQKSLLENGIIVGVFTSTLVKRYMNNVVLSTTSASKIYLDLDIDEVLALKKKSSSSPRGHIIQPLIIEQQEELDRHAVLSKLKTIGEVLEITKTDFKDGTLLFCVATIYDIHNNNGWYYNSCGCKGIIKAYGRSFWCKKCNKTVNDAIPRFRIELGVKDATDCTRFIVFDDVAEKMIGQSAPSIYDMQEKLEESEDSVGEVPAIIANLIGQRFVFRVKLTEYNRTAYKQSFTANKVLAESILEPPRNEEINAPTVQLALSDDGPRYSAYKTDPHCSFVEETA
ncbi:hypothetical protein DM860_001189 [Cuscuta australis]|uniref:Replication factor A C-terminal domain-containing protein n=1 Tax=Cuscuta australis TaxID=267555 RepID=A0A328DWW1_9ASTE|nr:hypothetical protein DM860_001189 [Cuscuta australis]